MARLKIRLYIAGPLGFSEAGRAYYYGTLIPLLKKAGFGILDPWKLTDQQKIAKVLSLPYGIKKKKAWEKLNLEIAQNNMEAIKRSSGVVAILDGTDVDSGTASEIGFAYGLGLPILGYRGDFRLAGDNEGSIVNLQVEGFIRKSGGDIVDKISELPKKALEIFK